VSYVTKKQFEEFKKEMIADIRQQVYDGIASVEEAKRTAEILLEAKKYNIERLVSEAVQRTVNSKIDILRSEVKEYHQQLLQLHHEHLQYHKENEHNWGFVRRWRQRYDKNPIKAITQVVLIILAFFSLMIYETRSYIAELISHLFKMLRF